MADVDWLRREEDAGQFGIGVDLAGVVGKCTKVTAAVVRGPVDLTTPLTILGAYRTTARVTVEHPQWGLTGGDLVTSNHVLAGPTVRADGVNVQLRRRIVADFTVARPNYFGGPSGGHVVQGRLGVATRPATISLIGSDLSRPPRPIAVQSVSVTGVVPDAAVSELDELRRVLSRENFVRGWGVEGDFRFLSHQSVLLRAGTLELANQFGARARGAAAEGRYLFSTRAFNLNAYARKGPPSVAGTYVPGDTMTVSARSAFGSRLAVLTNGYSNADRMVGREEMIRSRGVVAGLEYSAHGSRLSVQLNYRTLDSPLPQYNSITRTVRATASVPVGPVRVEAQTEAGPGIRRSRRYIHHGHRLRVHLDAEPVSVWAAASFEDFGLQAARSRADAGVSIDHREMAFEIGGGYGKGQLLGNDVSAWASAEVPLGGRLFLISQIDYFRWDYSASPYLSLLLNDSPSSPWRLTIGVRRAVTLPFPFLRALDNDKR